jgi:4-hydroxy-tetrahydrodipicolinate reductase
MKPMKKYKVIQYATGVTGKIAIGVMADHPELELVGLLVHDKKKVGKDAGELAGLGRKLGVIATDSLAEVLKIEADAVSYNGMYPHIDTVCAMLESGKHVVLTAGFVYPKYLGADVEARLAAACAKGKACVFGGGISPGFVQTVAPIALSNLARRIDRLVVEEFVDFHDVDESPELIGDMLGFGRSLEDVTQNKHPHYDEMMPKFFNQTVALTADALKVKLDRIDDHIEYFVSPGGGEIACLTIAPGMVGGVRCSFSGIVDGQPRIVVILNWACTYDLGAGWFNAGDLSNSTQWRVTVHGDPSMRLTFEQADHFSADRPNERKSTEHSFIITVMNVLHAIPYLCEAKEPGIKHYGNLPLMAGRYALR